MNRHATPVAVLGARYGVKSVFLPNSDRIMQAAEPQPAPAQPAASLPPEAPAQLAMSREFILRHQIVERYLAGRLPPKGVQDFERFCAANPALLDEIGLPMHVNAALRLLEAGGRPPPWEERPRKFWETPYALIAAVLIALALGAAALYLRSRLLTVEQRIAGLQQQIAIRPIDPATSTRSITLIPSRTAPSRHDAVILGDGPAQIADLRIDMGWSAFSIFRVTIDRIDQGRVGVLYNVLRDSSGQVHIGLNTSALGSGSYQFTLEGLNWRGAATPQAWVTVGVSR